MGMSANQARFLSLTSRQVDLEYRMQQICHRRLRLASELEKIATKYNNALSDRKLFSSTNTMYEAISLNNLQELGYSVIDGNNNLVTVVGDSPVGMVNAITQMDESTAIGAGLTVINNASELISAISSDLNGDYILMCDIDMAELGQLSDSAITGVFAGSFNGNGYAISNLDINVTDGTDNIGFFSEVDGATIENVTLVDSNITAAGGTNRVGTLVGYASGAASIIDNCATINANIEAQGFGIGGLLGYSDTGTTVSNSYSTGSVSGTSSVGGLVGDSSDIINSFSTASATGTISNIGGLVGYVDGGDIIQNSYATGDVVGVSNVGGLVGYAGADISNSYATGSVSGSTDVGAFVGDSYGDVDNTNFWNTDIYTVGYGVNSGTFNGVGLTSAEIYAGVAPVSTSFTAPTWDISSGIPVLAMDGVSSSGTAVSLEDGLRDGIYSLAREADSYTQEPININGVDYEKVDWRIVPTIDDDLFTANDADAEAEYDSAIEKINSQDKKLQLEQSQVEVEHKAILTQKDAVKNILNKNIESSFKTFS